MPLPPPNRRHGVPCPVHLPGRRGILAAWHVGRGNPRPGPGFPDRRRIASTRPGRPGLPGGPGEAVKGRLQSAAHYTGIISASPANFPGRARRHGGRASFSAPSLPDSRHACRDAGPPMPRSANTCRSDGASDCEVEIAEMNWRALDCLDLSAEWPLGAALQANGRETRAVVSHLPRNATCRVPATPTRATSATACRPPNRC